MHVDSVYVCVCVNSNSNLNTFKEYLHLVLIKMTWKVTENHKEKQDW